MGIVTLMAHLQLWFQPLSKPKGNWSLLLRRLSALAFALSVSSLIACRTDNPATRVSLILHELAPSVHLGQALADARRVYPTLVVQHERDLHDYFPRSDTTRIYPVAVTALPASPDPSAARDTIVESFEFVTSPSSAAQFAAHVAEVFQVRPRVACGSLAVNGRDSVLTFDTHGRGGVTITFPERRADYGASRSHVFVYSGRWFPEHLIPNYQPARCAVAAHMRISPTSLG
jgi:hypothetical protein